MKEKKKNKIGIKIIVSVITVILVGISIVMLMRKNGILDRGDDAKEELGISQAEEEIRLKVKETIAENNGNVTLEQIVKKLAEDTENTYIINLNKQTSYLSKTQGDIKSDSDYGNPETYANKDAIYVIHKGYEIQITKELKIGAIGKIGTMELQEGQQTGNQSELELEKTDETAPYLPNSSYKKVAGTSLATGLVITDSVDGEGNSTGNEWVWIEVPKSITKECITDDEIEIALQGYATLYRKGSSSQNYSWTDEWTIGTYPSLKTKNNASDEEKATEGNCGLTLEEYTNIKRKMLQGIKENGGFWITRYEVGDSTATQASPMTVKSTQKDDSGIPVSKANQVPYTYVTCDQAERLVENLGTAEYGSGLLFGIQWDLVCKYLEVKLGEPSTETNMINNNSTSWGNYSNSALTLNLGSYYSTSANSMWTLYTEVGNNVENVGEETIERYKTKSSSLYCQTLTTGASEEAKRMEIYDFAGNVPEWTLEYATSDSNYPCAYRGGYCIFKGSDVPASYRSFESPTGSLYPIGFRGALYKK